VAVTPDGALVLTADRDSNEVSIIDGKTNTRVGAIKVGERPFGVTIDESGQWAFTANVGSDDVSVIDIKAREVIGTVKVGRRPYAVALASGRAFVTDQYGGTVTVFGIGSLRVIATVEVGDHPEGIAADADGRYLYVACWMDNELVKIDARTMAVVGRVAVGDGPRAFGAFLR
jgi:YVTN family beta-propeller protein